MADEQPWSRFKAEIYSIVGRNPRSNMRLVRHAQVLPDSSILDIGCGPGAAVRRAARIALAGTATGVDASPAMIDIARRRSGQYTNIRYAIGPAEDLPFDDSAFSHVWSIHAFHHWNDQHQGLAECLRVLAPGGRVFIAETRGSGGHALSPERGHEVAQQMEDLGFTESSVERVFREIVVVGRKPVT